MTAALCRAARTRITSMERRYFKGDRWTRGYGSAVPAGAEVRVLRFFPRRKALVDWQGTRVVTMVWCPSKREVD